MGASQRADLYTLYLSARHVSSLGDISALGAGTESRNEDKSAQGGGATPSASKIPRPFEKLVVSSALSQPRCSASSHHMRWSFDT